MKTNTSARPRRVPCNHHADAVAAFRAEHGRWPSQTGATPAERTLYSKVRNIRTSNSQGILTAAEMTHLDAVLPGWNTPLNRDREWNLNADLTAAFVRTNRRLPRHHAGGELEKTLALWMQRCRSGAERPLSGTRIDAARREFLNTNAPGWDTPWEVKVEQEWYRKATELAVFRADTGRWPSGKSSDPAERAIASFRDQARAKKRGALNPPLTAEQIMHLNATIPGWTSTHSQEAVWDDNARLLALFRSGRDRWPELASPDALERRLARWFHDVRGAANGAKIRMNITDDRRALLDSMVTGWDAPYQWPASRRAA